MADTIPVARRFRTAAPHYLVGRQPYAPRLIRRVAAAVGVGRGDRVLDLGCGPGMLAGAFAPLAGAVVAMDPEPEMLRIAAQAFPHDNIEYRRGGSADLPADLGGFRLVVMGRSFHWMDRAETLRRLEGMIAPGGAVVLFHAGNADVPVNAWRERYAVLVQSYAGKDPAHSRRRGPDWMPHLSFLLDSAFSSVDGASSFETHEVTAAQLVDRAFSRSTSSPEKLGSRADALARDIHALVAELAPGGMLREVVESSALIARRPAEVDA